MKIKNIMLNVLYILVFLIFIFYILIILQKKLFPEKLPNIFGIKLSLINDTNMMPEIKKGDYVFIKKVKENELKENDIIIYKQGYEYVTSRITKIININEECVYKTRGDNNNTENSGEISFKLIEGKVIGKISYIGKCIFDGIIITNIIIFGYLNIKRRGKRCVDYER